MGRHRQNKTVRQVVGKGLLYGASLPITLLARLGHSNWLGRALVPLLIVGATWLGIRCTGAVWPLVIGTLLGLFGPLYFFPTTAMLLPRMGAIGCAVVVTGLAGLTPQNPAVRLWDATANGAQLVSWSTQQTRSSAKRGNTVTIYDNAATLVTNPTGQPLAVIVCHTTATAGCLHALRRWSRWAAPVADADRETWLTALRQHAPLLHGQAQRLPLIAADEDPCRRHQRLGTIVAAVLGVTVAVCAWPGNARAEA